MKVKVIKSTPLMQSRNIHVGDLVEVINHRYNKRNKTEVYLVKSKSIENPNDILLLHSEIKLINDN